MTTEYTSDKIRKLARANRPQKLPLGLLYGFQKRGLPFDPRQYGAIGFPHPRTAAYYDDWQDGSGFGSILGGIRQTGRTDEPVLCHVHEMPNDSPVVLVLDGLTRCSAYSLLADSAPERNSDKWQSIPCVFVSRPKDCRLDKREFAFLEMIRRNMSGRKTSLGTWEMMRAVGRIKDEFRTDSPKAIATLLGRNGNYHVTVSGFLRTLQAVAESPELEEKIKSGELTQNQAFELARSNPETRDQLLVGDSVQGLELDKQIDSARKESGEKKPRRPRDPRKSLESSIEKNPKCVGLDRQTRRLFSWAM